MTRAGRFLQRLIDNWHKTYLDVQLFTDLNLYQYFPVVDTASFVPYEEQIRALSRHYLEHRFDLLGSGWVKINYGMVCRGVEGVCFKNNSAPTIDGYGRWLMSRINTPNVKCAQHIWRLIDAGYEPIDWQLDFKSGYRWNEKQWSKNISIGEIRGADIKVPWELARMQHLVQLAWAFVCARSGKEGFRQPDVYKDEFRNQVLDFIATNPPRFGVNWYCAMDVAIRCANWLCAHDIIRAHGGQFDQNFNEIFVKSIYEHAQFIYRNLENHGVVNGNHYLADIAGLLFAAAYLPRSPDTDVWLSLGTRELIREVGHQFNADGSNFEASTSYHRLSAEMVVYCTALILGLPDEKVGVLRGPEPGSRGSAGATFQGIALYSVPGHGRQSPFPPWYFERVEKMAEFAADLTKPNGDATQIGDNDSGRFIKLFPLHQPVPVEQAQQMFANLAGYRERDPDGMYWAEDHLNHQHLASAVHGLFRTDDGESVTSQVNIESMITRSLAGIGGINSYRKHNAGANSGKVIVGDLSDLNDVMGRISALPLSQQREVKWPGIAGDVLNGLEICGYPDFGVYIFRSKRLYLVVRCGPIGLNGLGAHAHNDQLSVGLTVDGDDLMSDPGTYLYTPFPEIRDNYRSVKAHYVARINDHEPGNLGIHIFALGDEAKATCLYFGRSGFAGVHYGYGEPMLCAVRLTGEGSVIRYGYEGNHPIELPDMNAGGHVPFSSGYGIVANP